MQVYKNLDQITNKHPLNERDGVPHHVMNHVDWNEDYFIHRYSEEANKAIEDIHARGKVPIIIGGTHYYLQNLLFTNKTVGDTLNMPKEVRETTEEENEILDGPVDRIFQIIKELDPVIAEKFHPQDKRKLRRALQIYWTTGEKPSKLYHEQKLDELEDSSLKYNTLLYWVFCDPEILKPRLDVRVDKMMESGARDEIHELYEVYKKQEPSPDCTRGIWQVIGFKEFLPWLEAGADLQSLFEEGVERMKIRTRQYAKHQVKWIRKLLSVELEKESRFNFKYGGKLYLLDASDLSQWQENVHGRGIGIANQFLQGGPSSVAYDQAPEQFKDMISENLGSEVTSNKRLGSENNWKHFTCDICKDKNGNPMVAVGEESWKVHVQSRRHRRLAGAGERKRKHEMMMQANERNEACNTGNDKNDASN